MRRNYVKKQGRRKKMKDYQKLEKIITNQNVEQKKIQKEKANNFGYRRHAEKF